MSHAFYEYLIEEDKYKFSALQKEHLPETNLQKVVDNLDKYFILNKMRYSAEIINNRNVVAINYRLFLYEEIMNHLRNNPLDHVPAAKIYYNVILTLTEPENKLHYSNLLLLLEEHRNIFSREELLICTCMPRILHQEDQQRPHRIHEGTVRSVSDHPGESHHLP